jgi:hypothetical protein
MYSKLTASMSAPPHGQYSVRVTFLDPNRPLIDIGLPLAGFGLYF